MTTPTPKHPVNVSVISSPVSATRQLASSGSKFEPVMGYCRAVRSGQFVFVSGTVGALPDGSYPAGVTAQTERALEIIVASLRALGGDARHVVRTRIYITDISQWREVAPAHAAYFGQVRPATSLIGVAKLIDEAALIEIEADALID